jgi:hypothetical protein
LPLSSDDPKARGQVRDSIRWNNQMVKLLQQLISGLSDTIQVWDHFQQKDIGYFRCQSDPPNSLASSLDTIERAFGKLRMLRTKLQTLKKELCDNAPQGVSCIFHPEFQIETLPSVWYLKDSVTNKPSSLLF